MPSLVTALAPAFTAPAVMPDDSIEEAFSLTSLRGSYVLILFYPLDFSFVGSSEIIAFDRALDELHARETEVVGISVDSPLTHLAFRRTPRSDGGIGSIGFPLVSDLSKSISRDYGVLVNETVALPGLFLLGRDGIVRHCVVSDPPVGRSVDEALRMVDALRFHEERGEVCPANWRRGRPGMTPTHEGVVDYLSRFASER